MRILPCHVPLPNFGCVLPRWSACPRWHGVTLPFLVRVRSPSFEARSRIVENSLAIVGSFAFQKGQDKEALMPKLRYAIHQGGSFLRQEAGQWQLVSVERDLPEPTSRLGAVHAVLRDMLPRGSRYFTIEEVRPNNHFRYGLSAKF